MDDTPIPMQPLADESANLAREFAKLLELEQERAEAARREEFASSKLARLKQSQVAETLEVASAYEKAAQAGAAWQQRVEKVGGIMQSLASGNVGGGLAGVFGWMAERGKDKDGKDNPATLTNAIGTWGGVVVGAFQAVGGAAMGLVGIMKSASPAFASAWGEVMDNLMAQIGIHLLPVLAPLVANIILYSETIAEWVGKVAMAIKDAVDFILAIVGAPGAAKKAVQDIASPVKFDQEMIRKIDEGLAAGKSEEDVIREMKDAGFGGPGGGKGGKGGAGGASKEYIGAFRLFVDSMKTNQGGRPSFEGVDQAWRRIMQSTAGTSDLRQQTLELQRKMVDLLERQLAALEGKDGGSSQTTELGPDPWEG